MKKNYIIYIALIIFVSLFLIPNLLPIALLINGCSSYSINQSNIEKSFEKDKNYLISVKNYLCSVKGNVIIYCSMDTIEMKIDGETFPINGTTITEELTKLRNLGYNTVEKGNNYVAFLKWSNLDSGRGIVYSVDGNKPNLPFLTKLEPLNEERWYYYEEDFNEWKKINGNSNIPDEILGVWNIRYAKTRGAGTVGENYPLQDLYGTAINEYGGTLTFNADGTFSRYIGITTDETDKYEGTYYLHYDKIRMKYYDGTERVAKYMPESQEMVYYTWDSNGKPIDEFYQRQTQGYSGVLND